MENYNINNRIFYTFTFLLLYKLTLDFLYIKFVHKFFNYMGFILDFNIYKYVTSFLWLFIIFLVVPKDNKKPSSIFLQLHFIIMIIPMLTTYALANESDIFLALCCSLFIMQCLILRIFPSIKLAKIRNSYHIIYVLIITITGFVYISMIRANGIPTLEVFNLYKVYGVRAIVKYPFLMSYLVPWQGKIINPFLISISYINKNKKLLVISILMQIFLYLIVAHKTFLFIPAAIIIIIRILEKSYLFSSASLLALLGTIIAFLSNKIWGNIMFPSLTIRRFLFVPSQLKFYYYDFFSRNEFLFFSEGLIGKIFRISSPYKIRAANMIGDIYCGSIETAANTGYLADAYANMGVLGMLILSILFSIILILINSVSKNIKNELVVGISIFSILALNDSALLTTLFTGGLLFLLLLLYLYSNNEQNKNNYAYLIHDLTGI